MRTYYTPSAGLFRIRARPKPKDDDISHNGSYKECLKLEYCHVEMETVKRDMLRWKHDRTHVLDEIRSISR